MRHNRISKLFFGSFLATAALAATPATAQTPYDGLWSVTIMTKAGSCEPQTRSTLTVTDGKVSASGADRWRGDVSARSGIEDTGCSLQLRRRRCEMKVLASTVCA